MRVENDKQLKVLREGGRRLARAMNEIVGMVGVGISTQTLENRARELLSQDGDRPAFLGYQPHGASRPYPASLCVSINDEVVHGIPNESPRILSDGDVVTLDMGLVYNGLVTDMAHTVGVGNINGQTKQLISVAKKTREIAIAEARAGNTTGDIGNAVETFVRTQGFSVPRELGGHGVGNTVHEEPFIPNFGRPGIGVKLEEGMVIAIEPIVIVGKGDIEIADDGYTYISKDGSWSAQFEHTILVAYSAPEVLTKTKSQRE